MAEIILWLNLLVRWLHVITGVAWIGASFYFNWLEGNLERRFSSDDEKEGDLWAIHGGGFYHVEKYRVAPETLPETLHWFKWEAYLTWVTGFLLLCIVYYWGANAYLIDPSVYPWKPIQAIVVSLFFLLGSWFSYDAFCRSSLLTKNKYILPGTLFLFFGFLAYSYAHIFSARAAFIHVGASIGTVMAANVFRVIIPNQKIVVAQMINGEKPDPSLGKQALQRSLHNNYFTLPVLFIMISNHYPIMFAHRLNWLLLAVFSLGAMFLRHYFNLKNRKKASGLVLPLSLFLLLTLPFVHHATHTPRMTQSAHSELKTAGQENALITDVKVIKIFKDRCQSCHSQTPTDDVFKIAPNGVIFDHEQQIIAKIDMIKERVVSSETMPIANKTKMTPSERAYLARWIEEFKAKSR